MRVIIHDGENLKEIFSLDGRVIQLATKSCTVALWDLAAEFPEELICWCHEELVQKVDFESWRHIFHHELIMASYSGGQTFLPDSIGYIDLLPFANEKKKVVYGTWKMSGLVGGVKGKVVLEFKELLGKIQGFSFLLNSIAKIGQQNGLLCYSEPDLLRHQERSGLPPSVQASDEELFRFVYMQYATVWIFVLLWCFFRYQKKLPFQAFIQSFTTSKVFGKKINLSQFSHRSRRVQPPFSDSIDVILPTIGRPSCAIDVLEDLKRQTLLPARVIVVEQNPEPGSKSELEILNQKDWPFEVIHHLVYQVGACSARNLALTEVHSDWVFFCDDDNRLDPDVIKKCLLEIRKIGCEMITTAYRQPGEKEVFGVIKQWGTFGAGNSIVKAKFLKGLKFSPIFENGYGEDKDFGMQLRDSGCDIIYHPEIKILHLKAPIGGFRLRIKKPWEEEDYLPKPSPTVMAFALLHFTTEQIKGYKVSYFLKNLRSAKGLYLFSYLRTMERRWQLSYLWAQKLIDSAALEDRADPEKYRRR